MTKPAMPEPVAIAYEGENGMPTFTATMDGALSLRNGDALITTTQAEAYADAVRREALEGAARACEARFGTGSPGIDTTDVDVEAGECAAAIRALIPPTE